VLAENEAVEPKVMKRLRRGKVREGEFQSRERSDVLECVMPRCSPFPRCRGVGDGANALCEGAWAESYWSWGLANAAGRTVPAVVFDMVEWEQNWSSVLEVFLLKKSGE